MLREKLFQLAFGLAYAGVAGCASHHPIVPSAALSTQPAVAVKPLAPPTRSVDPRIEMTLDEIPPRPALAPPRARPQGDPPVESLQLYARARIAMLDGQAQTSINLLEKAASLDPWSFQLRYTLARLYQGERSSDERSIMSLEQAALLEPDHLALQLNLGRQYLDRGQTDPGVAHLLLALKTRDYAQDTPSAAVADYFLAHTLQQQGYDAAAVTLFRRLKVRLRNASFAMRATPELGVFAERPEEIDLQIGELEQKRGRYDQALAVIAPLAEGDSAGFELQSRTVRLLLLAGRAGDADRRAEELVLKRHADADSLSLLREVCRSAGEDSRLPDELGNLYRTHPSQRQILFAQVDQLQAVSRFDDARHALDAAAVNFPDDFEIAARRFELLVLRGDRRGAAAFLIASVARQPDWAGQSFALFSRLVRPSSHGRLKLGTLQTMEVAPSAEASKEYWISKIATLWHRDGVARDALDRAATIRPVFPPAWRESLDRIAYDPELDDSQRQQSMKRLADDAALSGDRSLAAELRGLALLRAEQPKNAIADFTEAVKLGGRAPELLMALSAAQRSAGNATAFEATLWKLVSDYPALRDGYVALHDYYAGSGSDAQAARVLSSWLAADPASIDARRLQAREYFRADRSGAADAILTRLYNEHPDDAEVVASLGALYQASGRSEAFISRMRERLAQDPKDFPAASELVALYQSQHRSLDAKKALDVARGAAAGDPDLLYEISGLYERNDQKGQSEAVLREVLAIEPSHAGANNDLGYFLSEDGKDLGEAERLVRRAVAADPRNTSFLDSLGWVLYKRGQFQPARKYLEKAVGGGDPDPVVLDHLGDVMYRLGDLDAARKTWDRALERAVKLVDAGSVRDELTLLRNRLKQKRAQLQGGGSVDVSPIATRLPDVSSSR